MPICALFVPYIVQMSLIILLWNLFVTDYHYHAIVIPYLLLLLFIIMAMFMVFTMTCLSEIYQGSIDTAQAFAFAVD